MNKEFKLLPPTMPNYISIEQSIKQRQDGFNPFTISVSELSFEEAEQYAELIKQSFIEHHKNKVINQNK